MDYRWAYWVSLIYEFVTLLSLLLACPSFLILVSVFISSHYHLTARSGDLLPCPTEEEGGEAEKRDR